MQCDELVINANAINVHSICRGLVRCECELDEQGNYCLQIVRFVHVADIIFCYKNFLGNKLLAQKIIYACIKFCAFAQICRNFKH